MGHHISKQQKQQMSDGHQMMSSIEQHAEPSTTAKGLNSCKNRQHASNAKKSKKLKAAARDVSQALAPAKAACQERNGSVVITIRLLKMESAGSFDTDAAETRSRHASYLNNNSAMLGPQHECESALSTSEMSKNTKNLHANSGNHNQNNSFSVENNNVHLNEIEASTAATSWITDSIANTTKQNCDNSRNGQLNEFQTCDKHSIKMQHNRASLSEASICDNNQTYSTSQSEKPSSTADCLQHALKAINFADVPTEIKIKPDDASPFIPPTLIGSVSPYPHHIPIAIRSDCLNSVADERSMVCLHGKSDASCCGKLNGVIKDSKEIKAKKQNWGIKLSCTKLKGMKSLPTSISSEPSSPSPPTQTTVTRDSNNDSTEQNDNNPVNAISGTISAPTTLLLDKSALISTSGGNVILVTMDQQPWFSPDEFSMVDCDKKARLQRAIEIAEGVEPPPGFISRSNLPTVVCANNPAVQIILQDIPRIHSQVDFIHCLVPDLKQITNCSFYWGKMDRYEAERLLENKPEGSFLLRDSAQEDYLFSVSFRKYGRSLHARIEQFNHMFSFDSHDPGVYTSKTVTGLLEHYKDPTCVMFFEPALTLPLNRNVVFSLQQLCRATIVSHTTYDGVNDICLPKKLKSYLKEYHYKQLVRIQRFDEISSGT